MEQETNSAHPGRSISNSVDGHDSDNLELEEESSFLVTDFSYHQMMDLTKNMVTAINHRSCEFKKRACAAIFGITQLAKSDMVNITTGLNSLWESYLHTEQEHLNSSKTADLQRKSKSFAIKNTRILFAQEVSNGSSGLKRGTPKGKKSKIPCGFRKNPTCTSNIVKQCPKLSEYDGIVTLRKLRMSPRVHLTEIVRDMPNTSFFIQSI